MERGGGWSHEGTQQLGAASLPAGLQPLTRLCFQTCSEGDRLQYLADDARSKSKTHMDANHPLLSVVLVRGGSHRFRKQSHVLFRVWSWQD